MNVHLTLLPTTEEGEPGVKLYAWVLVDATGREWWPGDDPFVLPSHLGPRIPFDVMAVYNIELRAEWDGQWDEAQTA